MFCTARRFDETEAGDAKHCTITEISPSVNPMPPDLLMPRLRLDPRAAGLLDHELFESITKPGKLLILGSWRGQSSASEWLPLPFEGAGEIRHRNVRVIRDYGMFDRREAPQFHPDVVRT